MDKEVSKAYHSALILVRSGGHSRKVILLLNVILSGRAHRCQKNKITIIQVASLKQIGSLKMEAKNDFFH